MLLQALYHLLALSDQDCLPLYCFRRGFCSNSPSGISGNSSDEGGLIFRTVRPSLTFCEPITVEKRENLIGFDMDVSYRTIGGPDRVVASPAIGLPRGGANPSPPDVFIEQSPVGFFSAPPPAKLPDWDWQYILLPASDYHNSCLILRFVLVIHS
jgi:hypothetical protein